MPVVRNPQYYFKEGFCWSNVLTTYIKCRKKEKTVHSTESMSFLSVTNCVPEYYMISIINSRLIAYYVDSFVNATSHCTTGDAKLIPMIIPTTKQLQSIQDIFNRAHKIRKKQSSNLIPENDAENTLVQIQEQLDKKVYDLYGII